MGWGRWGLAVVASLWSFSDMFQQSGSSMFFDGAPDLVHQQSADLPVAQQIPLTVEIPQVLFLDKVLTCPLPCTSGVRQNPHVFLNKVVDMPVLAHVLAVVLLTVEVPQLQLIDVVFDVPVVHVVVHTCPLLCNDTYPCSS